MEWEQLFILFMIVSKKILNEDKMENKDKMADTLTILKVLWKKLGEIPIDEDDCIEEDFYTTNCCYMKGTHREVIWHWFDRMCPNGVVKDLMYQQKG